MFFLELHILAPRKKKKRRLSMHHKNMTVYPFSLLTPSPIFSFIYSKLHLEKKVLAMIKITIIIVEGVFQTLISVFQKQFFYPSYYQLDDDNSDDNIYNNMVR